MEEEKSLIPQKEAASRLVADADADGAEVPSADERKRGCNPIQLFKSFRNKKILTVEPVMFLYLLGLLLYYSVAQQYVINRVGREKLEQLVGATGPWNFCINSTYLAVKTQSDETAKEVENEAAHVSLIISITSQFPSIIPALLYGPISDRIGRKPVLMVVGTSGCISAALCIIIVTLELNLYFFIVVSFVFSLGGGIPGMITIAYSYIADISSKKFLTIRLGILEAMIFLGNAVGIASGGQWLNHSGCAFVQPMFLLLACNMFIVFYVGLYLPESLSLEEREARAKNSTRGFAMITRGFKIFFFKEYSRWRLWFSLFAVFITYLLAVGIASVSTYFLFLALKWNAGLIGIFQSITELANGLALIIFLPIFVALRFPDALIVLLAEVVATVIFILNGFVKTTWEMFVIGILSAIGSLVGAPLRSIMSKMVAVEDQGALFSMIALGQVVASNISSVIFYFFYPYTLTRHWSAGSVYFLMAAIGVTPMPFIAALLVFRNRPGAVYKQPPLRIPDHLRRDHEKVSRSGAESDARPSALQSTHTHDSRNSQLNSSTEPDPSINADYGTNSGSKKFFDDDSDT